MSKLFEYFTKKRVDHFTPRVPSGTRIYAIGDVHGRDDLLSILLTQIDREIEQAPDEKSVLVFLGDLIDRGPHSAGVLDRLLDIQRQGRTTVFLLGNHEEALLRVLNGEAHLFYDWLRFGGDAFAKSYGVRIEDIRDLPARQAVQKLRDALPTDHIAFISGFHDSFRAGDYFFCHAGIRPGEPLEDQQAKDLRWIRSPFLAHQGPHEAMIVHGHTISEAIDRQKYRIGIDTGAYKTGVLSALGLRGTDQWILQATL